jgi:hypothetical protein
LADTEAEVVHEEGKSGDQDTEMKRSAS